jgi:uncharacterized protein
MSWQLVPLAQVRPAPWHNGGGVTCELLAWPRSEEWTVRLSVAEVARDGPFSRLPGVRRWFAVLSGEGVRLRVGNDSHQLGLQTPPFEFDGGAKTDCELLGGATRDFNLMLRHGVARMERVTGACSRPCKSSTLLAAYANGVAATLSWATNSLVIPPNTLAWRILESDALVQLAGDGALWMEIEP